jgi:hypothetical protein
MAFTDEFWVPGKLGVRTCWCQLPGQRCGGADWHRGFADNETGLIQKRAERGNASTQL